MQPDELPKDKTALLAFAMSLIQKAEGLPVGNAERKELIQVAQTVMQLVKSSPTQSEGNGPSRPSSPLN